MRFDPGGQLFGVAAGILIECADKLLDGSERFSEEAFCAAIGAPWDEARPVIESLIAAGYLERVEGYEPLKGTKLFNQLANAHVSPGMTRPEAQILLDRVIAKAESINADPQYACKVTCIAVFGSYLTDAPVLGDLDLGIAHRTDRTLEAIQAERGGLFDRLTAPSRRTFAALRLRKPKQISLHEFSEIGVLKTPFKVVFGDPS